MHQMQTSMLFLAFIFSMNLFAQDKLLIVVGEYPPLVSQHLKHNGVTARIVVEAFALEGVQVEYKFTNWARAFHLVNNGKADGIGPILKNAEREKFYHFSDSLLHETQVFFHLRLYPFQWQTMKDLKGIPIGATIGYSYGKAFDEAETSGQLQVQRVTKDKQSFKKLFNQRIKIFPQSIDVGYYMLQTEFSEKAHLVTHHPKFVNQSNNYFALSKRIPHSQNLLKRFNLGLKKLRENGKYEQYFQESRNGDYIIKK